MGFFAAGVKERLQAENKSFDSLNAQVAAGISFTPEQRNAITGFLTQNAGTLGRFKYSRPGYWNTVSDATLASMYQSRVVELRDQSGNPFTDFIVPMLAGGLVGGALISTAFAAPAAAATSSGTVTGATASGAGTIGASSTSYAAAATTGAAASSSALAPAVVSSAGATASWASGGVAATTSGGLTGLNSLVQTGTMALALARKGIAVLTGNDRPQQSPELNNPISSGGNFGSIYPELFGAPIGGAGAANAPGQEKGTLGDILTRSSSLIWIIAGLLLLGGLFFMLKRR